LQTAGSLAGKARTWIQCSDAANDGTSKTKSEGTVGLAGEILLGVRRVEGYDLLAGWGALES
jgi:hypothetical protein